MGDYRVTVEAVGGHGCSRKTKSGEKVIPCGQPSCVDCAARDFVARLGGGVTMARLEHWPVPGAAGTTRTENAGPVDDLITGVRTGQFADADVPAPVPQADGGFGRIGRILAAGLLALAALAAPAFAQAPAASPSPTVTVAVYTGTVSVLTRGERREYVSARVTANADVASKVALFARVDLAADQDGGALTLASDPKTFRDVFAVAGLKYHLTPANGSGGVDLVALGGATASVEGEVGAPVNSRLYTLAGLARVNYGRGGYVYAGAGKHDPVGGLAALAAASIPIGDSGAFTTIDFAFPFSRTVLQDKAWVLKVGANVRVKTFHF